LLRACFGLAGTPNTIDSPIDSSVAQTKTLPNIPEHYISL
jgi:hypothetical protein